MQRLYATAALFMALALITPQEAGKLSRPRPTPRRHRNRLFPRVMTHREPIMESSRVLQLHIRA